MNLATFSIPTFRKEQVQKRLEKLARKAAKYDNGDITFSFGDTATKEIRTENGLRSYEFIEITVSGEAPKVGGWQLVARIELMNDENLIHVVPGANVEVESHFRTHNGHCDHCNTDRRRNDVYVMTDGTREMAIGRTCLRDFLGIDDPSSIVNRAQFFEEIRNIEEEDMFDSMGSVGYFDLREVLLIAAAFIRVKGYVSKAKQAETGFETTGDCVSSSIKGVRGYSIETSDVDREWVEKTVEFFRDATDFKNEYMDNLRVLFKQDIVNVKHAALVSSAILAAQRQFAPKSEVKESNFVGEVKQRLKGLDLLLEKVIFLGSGAFGPSFLHVMKDGDGNAFSWITTNKIEVAEGSNITVDASVKQHKIYNGVKQTVLTRAKVAQ